MAAGFVAKRDQLELVACGTNVRVPDNPYAKLIYYLQCVLSCVPALRTAAALLDYTEYDELTSSEEKKIVEMAKEIPPGVVNGTIFCQVDDDDLPVGASNKFVKIELATDYVVAAASSGGAVLLGGRQVKAMYIMAYTDRWMEKNYWKPLADINSRQRQATPEALAVFVIGMDRPAPAPSETPPVHDPQPKPTIPALPAPLPAPATPALVWASPTFRTTSTARKSRHKRNCWIAFIIIVALIIAVAAVVVPFMVVTHLSG